MNTGRKRSLNTVKDVNDYLEVTDNNGKTFLIDKFNKHLLDSIYWRVRSDQKVQSGSSPQQYLHKLILNAPLVVHLNGDKTDNRLCNLKGFNSYNEIYNVIENTFEDCGDQLKVFDRKGRFFYISKIDQWILKGHYWIVNSGKQYVSESTSKVLVHRFIMNAPVGTDVDHIDRDRMNNTKENLRFATRSENCANKPSYGGSSQFKGVYKHKSKWVAQITCKQKVEYIGVFNSEVEAAQAYDKRAKKLFGEFAQLNF